MRVEENEKRTNNQKADKEFKGTEKRKERK